MSLLYFHYDGRTFRTLPRGNETHFRFDESNVVFQSEVNQRQKKKNQSRRARNEKVFLKLDKDQGFIRYEKNDDTKRYTTKDTDLNRKNSRHS